MATGLIGALRVTLGIDASEFIAGTNKAKAELRGFQREFQRTGKKIQKVGKDFTKWVTVPIVGAGVAIIKTAADFEASMNQVQINSQATGAEFTEMRDKAIQLGQDTSKSASEAADAMNMLAKTGVDARDIIDGAAEAAVTLSIATGSELDPATAAVSDTMLQFKKRAEELPGVIDQITGAVNESKFDFDDFQLGMGQAGAVAAGLGMKFEDFTATLAGTAQAFSSGSDAGTSLKTFLLRLTPQTKKAAEAMEELGLDFYDATGKLKPMAEIAQELQDGLRGLSDEAKTDALKKIFGTDALRTAIALADQGAAGIERVKSALSDTSAVDQANIRMKGFWGQVEQLTGALETLAIRIADSGMLTFLTGLVQWLGEAVDSLSKMNPTLFKWGVIIAGVAASFGPFMLVFGSFIRAVGVGLPLLMKLGPVFQALATGIGYLIPVVAGLARVLIAGLLANPILTGAALLITGIYLAWQNWDKVGPIVQGMVSAVDGWLKRLGAPLEWLRDKIDAAVGWFARLYDKVVGHSYIPDMVVEIGRHMRRLDAEMVQPVKKATSAATQAFQQLQQDVGTLLDRLFPEEARYNQFLEEMRLLEQGAKKLGFTAEETAAAIAKLRQEYAEAVAGGALKPSIAEDDTQLPMFKPDYDQIGKAADEALKGITKRTQEETLKQAEAWAGMARDAVSSMKSMVQSFKSGDILGGIMQVLDLVTQVVGAIRGITQPAVPTFNRGSSAPGYATGGRFTVGGSGGVDSQLIRLRATPGEQITVRRGDQMDRPVSSFHFDLRGAVMTQDLLDQMNNLSDQAAQRGAVGGAALAARQQSRARRRRL